MLLHDYRCENCGHVQEENHPFFEHPKIKCEICNGVSNKMIGSAGFILKGDTPKSKSRVRKRTKIS